MLGNTRSRHLTVNKAAILFAKRLLLISVINTKMQTKTWHSGNTGTTFTLVIAVNTFSKMALGWAFCGPLACILRPKAHGLAINLQRITKQYQNILTVGTVSSSTNCCYSEKCFDRGRHIDNRQQVVKNKSQCLKILSNYKYNVWNAELLCQYASSAIHNIIIWLNLTAV